jgi:hypothetical protein
MLARAAPAPAAGPPAPAPATCATQACAQCRLRRGLASQLRHQLHTAEWEAIKLRREKRQLEEQLARWLLRDAGLREELDAARLRNERLREALAGTVTE